MGLLSWIVFGLIAGALAKLIMPGDDPGGCLITIVLGVAGAFLGGFIATRLNYGDISGFDVRSLMMAIGGALLILLIYRAFAGKRRRR